MAKHSTSILDWAKRGAEARWHELRAEVASLVEIFPHLAGFSKGTKRKGEKSTRATSEALPLTRKRSRMSAAQKKAVSARMKKYWAERRKAAQKEE